MKFLVLADFDIERYGLRDLLNATIEQQGAYLDNHMAVTVLADTPLATEILLRGIPCQIMDTVWTRA